MLVDDSVVARSIFARVLNNCDGIQIICEASDSDAAVACLEENEVDIILLDIEMPKRSGLDALPDILAKANGARVLIVSASGVHLVKPIAARIGVDEVLAIDLEVLDGHYTGRTLGTILREDITAPPALSSSLMTWRWSR